MLEAVCNSRSLAGLPAIMRLDPVASAEGTNGTTAIELQRNVDTLSGAW